MRNENDFKLLIYKKHHLGKIQKLTFTKFSNKF